MHLPPAQTRSLDEEEAAVDLAQSSADFVFLSFSDSDLSMVAAAAREGAGAMSLRLANLAQLKHPFSVDLYVEKVASKARFVLVRLLGGLDYWRYGVEELSRAARRQGFALAILPGELAADERLDAASTLPIPDLRAIAACFHGGSASLAKLLRWISDRERGSLALAHVSEPDAAGVFERGCRLVENRQGRALIILYRSVALAGDDAPIEALAEALAERGLEPTAIFATSLKDLRSIDFLRAEIARTRPDVIINTTGFSARRDDETSVLDEADAPVLQAMLAGSSAAQWEESSRGLSGADLAMHVMLPEMDGRLITRAIAFKSPAARREDLEFAPMRFAPAPSRIGFVADLACAWARLRKTPAARRKIACVLSDYPGRAGRAGYAVGLDSEKSALAIACLLREAGYTIGALPGEGELMRRLESGSASVRLSLADYAEPLSKMPAAFVESVRAQWGEPEDDAKFSDGVFSFAILQADHLFLAVQPDRGSLAERKGQYHDGALAPRHHYIAFYIWLRRFAGIDALIHCGAHGTLEWLPGKSVALDQSCAPEAVLGPLPVIYPFIVSNPGEAAQAKRRLAAVTIGHMTPPLAPTGLHGAGRELEALFDEYASAETLDPKRARLLAKTILARAEETGFAKDCGLEPAADPLEALRRLDAFLCDVKDMRIADGLHVFAVSPSVFELRALAETCAEGHRSAAADAEPAGACELAKIETLLARCGPAEGEALLRALDGRFVPPGPGGAPSRGRLDILPTGRNLYGLDPRAAPTRAAWEIGRLAAREVMSRYAQDHGEWPRRIVMDLWASATMRTGGDDLAQALALIGARPQWDFASARVTGFEILSAARLEFPRVDVTLRISGLFRDMFPAQIGLFDAAVRAIAELDEEGDVNPLAEARRCAREPLLRIFGGAPSTFGIGISRRIDADADVSRVELGEIYLASASHAYGGPAGSGAATQAFAERVAQCDAFVHVQDQDGEDILSAAAIVDHVGGFAAAAEMLGNEASAYFVDAARPGVVKARAVAEEIARVAWARAASPRWIAGQMRHGHRGGAEIAEVLDHLFAFAVLTDAVASRHFELVFDAICGAPEVRAFLIKANPEAARAIVERFEAAARRGFWRSRRNSSAEILASMREALGC